MGEQLVAKKQDLIFSDDNYNILKYVAAEETGELPEVVTKSVYREVMIIIRKNTMRDTLSQSDITSKLNREYKDVTDAIEDLEEQGLLMTKKIGRERKVKLTDDGHQIAANLMEIEQHLKEPEKRVK